MYLSRLILNMRSADARRDAGSAYNLHSTLVRMFAAQPTDAERMLFRLEPPARDRPPMVLVQSRTRPDFEVLPRGYCLQTDVRDDYGDKLDQIVAGQRLSFRLLANPTKRQKTDRPSGRRVPLLDWQAQEAWLRRKLADEAGAELVIGRAVILDTQRNAKRGEQTEQGVQTHVPVLFEGVLQVTNPMALRHAIGHGIGPAKGYGFGLLSLARA